jgi:type VI secretion system protein VasJ
MLGRITAERRWQWSATGKHPAAKDFFTIGTEFPLARAFAEWAGKGYGEVSHRGGVSSTHLSWRFWTREARRDHVACGILRDSYDAVGRPYPFLVMGSGPLAGWDDNWDLIPYVCQNAWAQIEYLSVKGPVGLGSLETEIQGMKSPVADWDALRSKRERFESFPTEALKERLSRLSDTDPFLSLDRQPYDQLDLAGICHYLSRRNSDLTPNVVFMGGTVEHTYFAVFRRALSTADFGRLWSFAQ